MRKNNGIRHTRKLWLAGALFAACFLCGCTRKEELLLVTEENIPEETVSRENAATLVEEMPVKEPDAESSLLYVHVCGAVKAPGVYELPAESRVYEAVQAAGGFSSDAAQNYVNQAQILTDGVKLVIPTREEAAVAADGGEPDPGAMAGEKSGAALQLGIIGGEAAPEDETAKPAGAKININTASKEELCSIPGVGETRAAAIVSYRESHGSFAKPEDIMKVSGIKEGMYEKIKDSISVY